MTLIKRFLRDESGATVVEYGLILAVLSLVIVAGIGKVADSIEFLFADNNSQLQQAFR
ncbi:MAG: Flp family type IVb pilin [Mesorhizobium amorphae]|nr:MAG: Flp family type IVb pilin [Mesorhizobium amorphae]